MLLKVPCKFLIFHWLETCQGSGVGSIPPMIPEDFPSWRDSNDPHPSPIAGTGLRWPQLANIPGPQERPSLEYCNAPPLHLL